MMFDEESKKRTSEYIFGAEPKKSTPAKKSKVAKEIKVSDQMDKIISDTEYMKGEILAMLDKLKKMEDDYNSSDGQDTVEEEAMWNDILTFYESIAEKIDIYAEDIGFYLKGIQAISAKMHAEVGSWR